MRRARAGTEILGLDCGGVLVRWGYWADTPIAPLRKKDLAVRRAPKAPMCLSDFLSATFLSEGLIRSLSDLAACI